MPIGTFRTIIPRRTADLVSQLNFIGSNLDSNTAFQDVLNAGGILGVDLQSNASTITQKINERSAALALAESCTTAINTAFEEGITQLTSLRDLIQGLRQDGARQALADVGFVVHHTPANGSSNSTEPDPAPETA